MTQPFMDPTVDVAALLAATPPAQAVALAANTGVLRAYPGAGILAGWAFRETTGTTRAQINLYSGTLDSGQLIAPIEIQAGGSTRDWLLPGGILVSGIVAEIVSGSVEGSLWVVPQ